MTLVARKQSFVYPRLVVVSPRIAFAAIGPKATPFPGRAPGFPAVKGGAFVREAAEAGSLDVQRCRTEIMTTNA